MIIWGLILAISVRLEFEPFEEGGDGRATIGELRKWLELVDKNGVTDDTELIAMIEGQDAEITGFFVYGQTDN